MGKTIVNHPFGNDLYNLLMVIWAMVYDIVLPTLEYINPHIEYRKIDKDNLIFL